MMAETDTQAPADRRLEDTPFEPAAPSAPPAPRVRVMPPQQADAAQATAALAATPVGLANPYVWHSDDFGDVFAALADAQQEFEAIERTQQAQIQSRRTNASYTYEYADLASVLAVVRPVLARHGLAVVQLPTARSGSVTVVTVLGHKSGQWIKNSLSCACENADPQTIGSAITYLRRYALQSVVGVAPEQDDDGRAAAPSAHSHDDLRRDEPRAAAAARPSQALVTALRQFQYQGKTMYGIKTTAGGECYTDDKDIYDACDRARAASQPVALACETRKAGDTPYRWVVEVQVGGTA